MNLYDGVRNKSENVGGAPDSAQLLRLHKTLEPKKKEIENVLYPKIEAICYLMDKDLITDPKFTAPFQENFTLWKENLQEHMHIDGFPAFGQYPYFSRQYTKWQLSNPQASPLPTLDVSEEC